MITGEIWLRVKEYPNYSVSNLGRVKNNVANHIMIGGYDKDGYKQVTLQKNGKQYNRRVCRLVALTFIENPNELPMVNHIDENKENDNIDNLEWCTAQYNNTYGCRCNKTRKSVQCIETGKIYEGLRIAEKETGISHTNISSACRKNCCAGGYHWKYV